MTDPNNNEDEHFDVFISYAREDKFDAKKLSDNLEKEGIRTWLDTKDLKAGEWWKRTIPYYIRKSSYFMPLFSKNSINKRGFFQNEIKIALKLIDEHPPSHIFIIPIRLDNCNIPHDELFELNIIDLFSNYEEGIKKILKDVKPEKRKSFSNLIMGDAEIPLCLIPKVNQLIYEDIDSFQPSQIIFKWKDSPLRFDIYGYFEKIDFISNFITEKYSYHKRDSEIASKILGIIPQIYEDNINSEQAFDLINQLENRYTRLTDEELRLMLRELERHNTTQNGIIRENLIKAGFIDKGINYVPNVKDLFNRVRVDQLSESIAFKFNKSAGFYRNSRKFIKVLEKYYNELKQDFAEWQDKSLEFSVKNNINTIQTNWQKRGWPAEDIRVLIKIIKSLNEKIVTIRDDNPLIINPFLNINTFKNRLDKDSLIQIAWAIAKNKGKIYWDDFCKTLQSYAKFQRYELIKELDSNSRKWVEAKIYQFDDKRNLYLVPEIIPFINMHQSYFENLDESEKLNLIEGYINHVWGWAIV